MRVHVVTAVNKYGGHDPEDRSTWCTPPEITAAIGPVHLDPCGSPRATVQAVTSWQIERGEDGLDPARIATIDPRMLIYINCPYKRGAALAWIRAYAAFVGSLFLLRFDPSTEWFRALVATHRSMWIPPDRVDFVPPPGVASSSNPYPHALFMTNAACDAVMRRRLSGAGGVIVRVL
jgi:hypothetical protein